MTKKVLSEAEQQKLASHWYKLALQRMTRAVRETIEDAQLAHRAYLAKDWVGMRVLTEVWMRSAKVMALAVKRHPEYFDLTVKDDELPTHDTLIALFHMGQLADDKDKELFELWQEKHLTAWQVAEEIDVRKRRHARFSRQVLNVPSASVELERDPVQIEVLRQIRATMETMVKSDGLGNGTYELRLFEREEDERKTDDLGEDSAEEDEDSDDNS